MFQNSLKPQRQKFGIFSFILVLVIGLGFIVGGVVAVNSTKIDDSWTRVSGTVVDKTTNTDSDSTTYRAIISYSVNGKDYRVTSSEGSSIQPTTGSQEEVAYNPANPSEAKVVVDGTGLLLTLLFPVIGVVIVFGSIYAFISSRKRTKTVNNLMQTGTKLQGVIVDVQAGGNASTTTVGQFQSRSNTTYRVVVAAAGANGETQNYVSDTLTGIGSLLMTDYQTTPIPVDVYVDPTNPKNYYVDVSGIPSFTPQKIAELAQRAGQFQSVQPQPAQPTPPQVASSLQDGPTDTPRMQ